MKKQLKKISAVLLAFVVLFGMSGTFFNTEVIAASEGTGSQSEGQYSDITLDTLRPATEGGAGGPQDDEKRYMIIFDDTTDVGATWVPGYVDGANTSVTDAACIMMLGGKVTMLLQYDKVQAGATMFSQITSHTITFKAGTLLGNNYRLAEDLTLYVSGQTFSLTQDTQGSDSDASQSGGQYNDIILDTLRPATEGGAGGPQDGEKRYMIIFDDTTDVGAAWVTAYVDGAEAGVENAACIMTHSGEVVMLLQYDKVQEGATTASNIKEHIVTIKAGTLLGNNYKLAKDLSIKVSGQNFSISDGKQTETGETQTESKYEKIALNKLRSEADGGAGGAQDAEKRWLIIFDESTDVGATWVKGYVDGAAEGVDGIACIMMTGGKVTMLLQYDKVQAGATSSSQIKEHTIVFKAGTVLGDKYELANDVTIKVNGGNFELVKGASAETGDFVNPWNVVMFALAGTCMVIMVYAHSRRKEEKR